MESRAILPRLAGIRLHPIKSLDPASVSEAHIGRNGGLELDRAWALCSVDGQWINGKRTATMHLIRATYSSDLASVTLSVAGDRRNIVPATLAFPGDTQRAAEWFSAYFEQPVIVRYAREGFPDDGLASGPTIISTASLEAVCDWFPGITLEEARQRFRTTLDIYGVPAFWEDQLFGPNANYPVRFRIGEVAFEGSNPCARCPVPSRDPRTGADIVGFQKRFSDLRRAQLPPWSPVERFDHFYRLATNTRVASTESGKLLRLGDPVVI
jgi:uncharacterized protein YcbX